MGGAGATGDLGQGYRTRAWLAVSNDTAATVERRLRYSPAAWAMAGTWAEVRALAAMRSA